MQTKESSQESPKLANASRISSKEMLAPVILAVNKGN
jgi:hypothetical protein